MPTLKVSQKRFNQLMGESQSFQQLDELGFEFGIQVEKDQNQCDYKFECMNNRPDVLDENTLTRAFKIYLGKQDTPKVKLSPPTISMLIDQSVKSVRPIVVCAILRNVNFDSETMRGFLNLQQKLHQTFCRERKYASIGTHDLDTLTPPLLYKAVDPKDIHFVPLFQTEEMDGNQMMKALENSPKLKQYLHLIKDSPIYPVVVDSKGIVGSVPPIINSQHSKLTQKTKNILIEITALSESKARVCLNTLIWAYSEYCGTPFQVEPVKIIDGEKITITPNIQDRQFIIKKKDAQKMIDHQLTMDQILLYLKRSGLKGEIIDEKNYKVWVPFWRSDILHACDIIEDISIAFGYKNIKPKLPKSSTCGARIHLNKFSDFLRQQMAQSQFNEVLNFALCSVYDMTTALRNKDESQLISIKSAKTKEFQTGRTTLLSGLLRNILENKAISLPYRLFQLGDCILLDSTTDTGARNNKRLAAIITNEVRQNSKVSLFAEAHGTLELILMKSHLCFDKDYQFKICNRPHFFKGQQFDVIVKGECIGSIGVIHPEVLNLLEWNHPVVAWEIDVEKLQKFYNQSF